MLVLGIDPGSIRLGYGLVLAEGPRAIECVEAGTISAPAGKPVYERLAELGRDLEAVLAERRPDVVALEHGFVAAIRGKLQQGALVSSAARGMAGYLVARAGIPIVEYAPATVKKTVAGHGRADKPVVAAMVKRLLGLRKTPAPDAADALAIAICHAFTAPGAARIEAARVAAAG